MEKETIIAPEKCNRCDNVEERMTTIIVVRTDSEQGSAERLCKDCVKAYLDSRK